MGLIVFPFADIIVPLLLFDNSQHHHHTDHRHRLLVDQPSASTSIVAPNDIGVTAPNKLYRYIDGVISDEDATTPPPRTGSSQYIWNLSNGKVQFDRPLSFTGVKLQDGELKSDPSPSASISLWDPTLLGSGGSGAVFSFSTHPNNSPSDSSYSNKQSKDATYNSKLDDDDNNVAIKVSWKRSRNSVENECNILQSLENVPHVERCLGRPNPYPYEDGRVMIAVTPVVTTMTSDDGITSSLNNVKTGAPQRNAVKSVVEAIVGMLNLGIYTLDVQPLISVETGEVLFIDFTEAQHFSIPLTSLDESALVGFCGEVSVLIPDSLKGVAGEYLMAELSSLDRNTTPLPGNVVEILESIWID